eukprot:scaffold23755_cov163-Isochrysis_galbana.AAC.1
MAAAAVAAAAMAECFGGSAVGTTRRGLRCNHPLRSRGIVRKKRRGRRRRRQWSLLTYFSRMRMRKQYASKSVKTTLWAES